MPQLSITAAFTRAVDSLVGSKRKIDEVDEVDDGYDSDEIQVATARPRPPLQSVPASQAQNKRVRVLDCVLIPAPKRTVKQSTLTSTSVCSARATHSTARNGLTPRPRRSTSAKSRLLDYETSDDELLMPANNPNINSTLKKVTHDATVDEESDFEGIMSDTSSETSSANEASDSLSDSSDDDTEIPKKSAKSIGASTTTPSERNPTGKGRKTALALSTGAMMKLLKREKKFRGLDHDLPPMNNIDDIFADLTNKAFELGFGKVLKHLNGKPLVVGTMCSGTEAPLLALQMLRDCVKQHSDIDFAIDHAFSAEIEPYKQAFIERNYNSPVIFRDITEFTEVMESETPMATTAYGAKVAVRTDVDLLIAGTSCVDFSALNKKRKTLADAGESAGTWNGVRSYVAVAKPAIVMFENVEKAEWDAMITHYEELGYDVGAVVVSTKDYYLPQTRQRGYMVCFNKNRMEEAGLKALRGQWQSLMPKFKRLASSPITDFLLPSDSAFLRDASRPDDVQQEREWIRCEARHVRSRQEEQLGNARPYTGWQESGGIDPPENGSKLWYRNQVNRVKDYIDINLLRNAPEYDVRFKTRGWDVSQNVDMGKDSTPFGITGCLTPSGQPFVSDLARAMRPEEILRLQGIPLDRISLTTESAKEVQNLAGNAMSSTVVGAAMLSALISGYKLITPSPLSAQPSADTSTNTQITKPTSKAMKITSGNEETDVAVLRRIAEAASRRCVCEGGSSITRNELQKCQDCGHTTCVACGGNPQHNYRHDQRLSKGRISPQDAESEIRSKLPLRLKFVFTDTIGVLQNNLKGSAIERYGSMVETAAQDVFTIQSFRRRRNLTMTYQSLCGLSHLELVFTDEKAEWQLFVHPPDDLAANHPIREISKQPVARSCISQSLFDNVWSWRVPVTKKAIATITNHDNKVPSWRARCEMPRYRNENQPQTLAVTLTENDSDPVRGLIEGMYHHLPRCGTSFESLYKKVNDDPNQSSVYLFHDPAPVGAPENDAFVFSKDPERLNHDEIRHIVARVQATWKPWKHGRTEHSTPVFFDDEWIECSGPGTLQPFSTTATVKEPADLSTSLLDVQCDSLVELMSCGAVNAATGTNDHTWQRVKSSDSSFFSQNSWLFEVMRRYLNMSGGSEWRPFVLSGDGPCQSCAPEVPKHKWKLSADGESIQPFEDPQSAAKYERSIKRRPAAIAIDVKFSSDASKNADQITLGVNMASMAHRLKARLPDNIENVAFSWRLKTDFNPSRTYQSRPFTLKSTSGIQPYSDAPATNVELFPNQRHALAWMKAQEAGDGRQYSFEESEQECIPHLGWVLEMRARGTTAIRGGICAHHPGFGKTILTLEMIGSQLSNPRQHEILNGVAARQPELLTSTATLVICPTSLVEQWCEEARDKLGLKMKIDMFAIKSVPNLDALSLENISKARLVVVSTGVLSSDLYTERLATFTGIPGPAASKGRAFERWLEYATKDIPSHLRMLKQSGEKELGKHVKQKYQDNLASEDFKAAVPSRRLRGKNYVTGQKSTSKSSITKAEASASLDVTKIGRPRLEMFHFERVVLDEFQNYNSRELAVIKGLSKHSIWGLSGTPPIGDFYEVAKIGELLGITLNVGSDAQGIMRQSSRKKLREEMTAFEMFVAMCQVPLETTYARQYELRQNLLDSFVTRSLADSHMDTDHHLHPVTLDLAHRVVYTEISQHLNSMEMRIKKASRSQTTDREQRRNKVVASSVTAEEALCKIASYMDRSELCDSSGLSGLQALIDTREEELKLCAQNLRAAIPKAEKGERVTFEQWRQGRLYLDALGDQDTLKTVIAMCKNDDHVSEIIAAIKLSKKDKEDRSRGLTAAVNSLVTKLLTSHRSLRYVQSVHRLQQSVTSGERELLCSNTDCKSRGTEEDIAVSAFCGHMICKNCYSHMQERLGERCTAKGCRASMKDYHLLWKSKLGDLRKPRLTPHGAKIEAAVNLLNKIRTQGDQAVLFVQYESQLNEVGNALRSRDIKAVVLDKPAQASAKVEDFKTNTDITAIVLNASTETATGLNLQNANHAIFLSPLLRDQQYVYEATMAQAIGRVSRHGQKKKIHVHRFVALNTIDVDILEHRERRSTAISEYGAPEINAPSALMEVDLGAQPEPERVQLVREDGRVSLRPQSWLVKCGADEDEAELAKMRSSGGDRGKNESRVRAKGRVLGWEDLSSDIKFSRVFTENDE